MRSARWFGAAMVALAISGCGRDPAEVMSHVRRVYTVTAVYEPGATEPEGVAAEVRFAEGETADVEMDELLAGAEVRFNGEPLPRAATKVVWKDQEVARFGDFLATTFAPAAKYTFDVTVQGAPTISVEGTPTAAASFVDRAVTTPFGAPIHAAWSSPPTGDSLDFVEVELPDVGYANAFPTREGQLDITQADLAEGLKWPSAAPAAPLVGSLVLRRTRSSGDDLDQLYYTAEIDRVPLTITP